MPNIQQSIKNAVHYARIHQQVGNSMKARSLCKEIPQRMKASPLLKSQQITHDVETAYFEIWKHYVKKLIHIKFIKKILLYTQ